MVLGRAPRTVFSTVYHQGIISRNVFDPNDGRKRFPKVLGNNDRLICPLLTLQGLREGDGCRTEPVSSYLSPCVQTTCSGILQQNQFSEYQGFGSLLFPLIRSTCLTSSTLLHCSVRVRVELSLYPEFRVRCCRRPTILTDVVVQTPSFGIGFVNLCTHLEPQKKGKHSM